MSDDEALLLSLKYGDEEDFDEGPLNGHFASNSSANKMTMPSFVDDIDRQIEELQRIKETQLNRATSLNLEAKFKSRAMQQQSSRTNENKNPVVPLDNRKVFVTTEELFPKRGKPASSGPLDYAKRFAAARNHIRDHEAKASTKPKSRGFAMDMQKTHSDIDSSAIYTEESTKIRLDNLTIPESQVSMLLKKYRSLPLSDITKAMIEDDIPGDWISVAILYEKGLRKTSQNGKPFMMLRFTDLKGFRLNAFVFDAVLEASESAEIGSVIAFLNPKIIRPSERDGALGLCIDKKQKWLKLGKSVDMGSCTSTDASGKKCMDVLDKRRQAFCDEHVVEKYLKAKQNRPEFGVGTSFFTVRDPTTEKNVAKEKKKRTFGTYVLDKGTVISASGGDIKTHGFIHEGTKNSKVKDPVEEALLESMLHSNTQGARALRATMGVEFDQKPSKSAFGAVALRKIGFDPFTGQQHLAPPSTKKVLEDLDAVRPKAAKVAKKEEPDMIELELDDDDD